MKIVGITGYKGYLGSYLLNTFPNFIGLDCDVTNPIQVENCIANSDIDVVLHLAAKSDIDFCENPENQSIVGNVNLRGTVNVCRSAEKANVGVILLSSDHVFSGTWGIYKEKDKCSPVNYYGISKLAAEAFVLSQSDSMKIIRTSYLFDSVRLGNRLANLWNGVPTLYPTFITRTFMHIHDFSQSLIYYLDNFEKMPKILHISGNKSVSWHKFMEDIAYKFGIHDYKKLIIPRKNEDINKAPRPYHAGLNVKFSKKLGFTQHSYLQGIDLMMEMIENSL